jgi:hypothetical protein
MSYADGKILSVKLLNVVVYMEIGFMWPGWHVMFKYNTYNNKKCSSTKKTKTIFFKNYWNENILDRLKSTQVNLSNPVPMSWDPDHYNI